MGALPFFWSTRGGWEFRLGADGLGSLAGTNRTPQGQLCCESSPRRMLNGARCLSHVQHHLQDRMSCVGFQMKIPHVNRNKDNNINLCLLDNVPTLAAIISLYFIDLDNVITHY